MKKSVAFKVTVLLIVIILGTIGYYKLGARGEYKEANSIVAGDMETEEISYEQNKDANVAIASVTKLMTYLVIKDEIQNGNGSLEDIVTIGSDSTAIEGTSFLLQEGEQISVQTLIESMLIVSANDSAVALSKYFGGTTEEFVNKMNKKAQEIGLSSAQFYSPNGLSDYDIQDNTMSAKDIFKMSVYILKKYPEIINITAKSELVVPERDFVGENTNKLLAAIPEVDGLKTGFTDEAKYCLVSTAVGENGKRIVVVVMGAETSEERDEMSKNIIEKMLNNKF